MIRSQEPAGEYTEAGHARENRMSPFHFGFSFRSVPRRLKDIFRAERLFKERKLGDHF